MLCLSSFPSLPSVHPPSLPAARRNDMFSELGNRRSFLTSVVFTTGISFMPAMAQERTAGKRFAIAVHGGAGQSPRDDTAQAVEIALGKALDIGLAMLKS